MMSREQAAKHKRAMRYDAPTPWTSSSKRLERLTKKADRLGADFKKMTSAIATKPAKARVDAPERPNAAVQAKREYLDRMTGKQPAAPVPVNGRIPVSNVNEYVVLSADPAARDRHFAKQPAGARERAESTVNAKTAKQEYLERMKRGL